MGVSALKNGKMNALKFNLNASIRHFDRPLDYSTNFPGSAFSATS